MFKHYEEQLKKVSKLLHTYCKDETYSKEAKKALIHYLNEQDMVFVQLVQVILYVGKNKKEVEQTRKMALYEEVMVAFNVLKGWRPKEIEINQMVFAVPLYEHFEMGMALFNTLRE